MINNVVLVGRLTKDPDLRYTANGAAVATFTLAVNRNFTNQNGTREADFINCVIWRKPAETLANYARKGTLLGVVGRIQTRNYENQQGQRVYVTEVICESFQLLESKNGQNNAEQASAINQNNSGLNQSNTHQPQTNQTQNQLFDDRNPPFAGSDTLVDISDDDLPF